MKIESIKVGQAAEIKHTVTSEDIKKFVELTGDDNRIHTDESFASETSFRKPVVHGMLGASFISTLIGTKLPGDGSLWFSQNLEFMLPARIGDQLTIRAVVLSVNQRLSVVELSTDIYNQNKEHLTKGRAKVRVIEKNAASGTRSAPPSFDPKTVLVIGASGGIGAEVCRHLAVLGYRVVAHYMSNKRAAEKLIEGINSAGGEAYHLKADIRDQSQTKELVFQATRKVGSLSAVVVCASGKVPAVEFDALSWLDFDSQLQVQIRGLLNVLRETIPDMVERNYGKIVTVGSLWLDAPKADLLPYITAKGALQGFVRALAVEMAPKGIRVNSVSPGMTDTDLISNVPERVRLVNAARTPLRRLACPSDVARAIGFLVSPDSDYLAGETIRVNGGQFML